jgi:hypothetical protein
MTVRSNNLLYVVNPEFIAQLSDLQDELLESLTSIAEGIEGFKDVIELLDIPDREDIFGKQPVHESLPWNDDPF